MGRKRNILWQPSARSLGLTGKPTPVNQTLNAPALNRCSVEAGNRASLRRYLKISSLLSFLPLLFILFSNQQAFAIVSPRNYLHLTGWVIKDNKPLSNADITIWENDSLIYQLKSNFLGEFSLYIPFQKEYIIAFEKKGLIRKKVLIDTKTPTDPDPLFYYFFQFELELYDDGPYARKEFFNEPVAIVFYDTAMADFDHYKNTVRVFSTMTKDVLRDSAGVPFKYPAEFFDYVQALADQPNRIHLITDTPPTTLSDPEIHSNDTVLITTISTANNAILSEQNSTAPVKQRPQSVPENQEYQQLAENSASENTHRTISSKQIPTSLSFHFHNYRNPSEKLDFKGKVFFSVQLLATAANVPKNFFDPIIRSLPSEIIIHYKDQDELDKYIVGVYDNMTMTMAKFRQLRELGYECYIVAFNNNKRISVKEALSFSP